MEAFEKIFWSLVAILLVIIGGVFVYDLFIREQGLGEGLYYVSSSRDGSQIHHWNEQSGKGNSLESTKDVIQILASPEGNKVFFLQRTGEGFDASYQFFGYDILTGKIENLGRTEHEYHGLDKSDNFVYALESNHNEVISSIVRYDEKRRDFVPVLEQKDVRNDIFVDPFDRYILSSGPGGFEIIQLDSGEVSNIGDYAGSFGTSADGSWILLVQLDDDFLSTRENRLILLSETGESTAILDDVGFISHGIFSIDAKQIYLVISPKEEQDALYLARYTVENQNLEMLTEPLEDSVLDIFWGEEGELFIITGMNYVVHGEEGPADMLWKYDVSNETLKQMGPFGTTGVYIHGS